MQLDEAIKMALDYEGRVHKTYLEAMNQTTDEPGKRVFKTLCNEEMSHITYLRERLDEWQKTGKITVARLSTSIPSKQAIEQGIARLREKVAPEASKKYDAELQLLKKALEVEKETSEFYKDMVRTLDAEGQKLFERFVEIEQGHLAIVQAEIDCINGSGFWFDTPEFSLEMERG